MTGPNFSVQPADLDDPSVVGLLTLHADRARAETAAGSAHALDLDALRADDVRVWALYEKGRLLAVGALKALSPDHGEIKSMHTAEAARGRGAGRAILMWIVGVARADGMKRLSLETGSWPYFNAARAFYRANGFSECAPFPPYASDPNSVFMTMAVPEAAPGAVPG